MITPHEALHMVFSHLPSLRAESVTLDRAMGRRLAERIIADRDMPPAHQVRMDGIAIRYADFVAGVRSFYSRGIQRAGVEPVQVSEFPSCIEVMTGSILPGGLDTIIPYEQVEQSEQYGREYFTIHSEDVHCGQHIQVRAADHHSGDSLVSPGIRLGPSELGIAASVGKEMLLVDALPRTAILSTGDELVDVAAQPLPHQVRRSNAPALDAFLHVYGIHPSHYHLRDDAGEMRRQLESLLHTCDLLILSGGVSKGRYDLLPEVLHDLGVTSHFHRIAQKPGKPMWFGTRGGCTVFALPGNPVSVLACAARYLGPFLRREAEAPRIALREPVGGHARLTLLMPVRVNRDFEAEMLDWNGSGDYGSLAGADGFAEIAPGELNDRCPYYPLRTFGYP